ncbi:MAG: site-specific integrase [Clostridia bacterium]|nr:site-specific integrase [Clostridia bacterium]
MSKRGENIHKRKDGRWEARIRVGNKYKSIYAKSYTELKAKIRQGIEEPKPIATPIAETIMQDICMDWLSHMEYNAKQSTIAKYHHIVTKHIIPTLGNVLVADIDYNKVNAFIKEQSTSGNLVNKSALSSKTLKDIVCVLKQIFKFAQTRGYADTFSFELLKLKAPPKDLRALTASEQEILVQYLKEHITYENVGILLALFMGFRIGELCALQWRDVDIQNSLIQVSKTLQRIQNTDKDSAKKTIVIIDTPKSLKSVRIIPIPKFIQDILIDIYQNHSGEDYILTGNAHYMEPRKYQYKFKKRLKQIGLKDINFHALRHTFATRAVEQEMDIKSLSEVLGHATVSFTLDRYVHSSIELKRAGMEKLVACY